MVTETELEFPTVTLPLWKNLEAVAQHWEYGSEHSHKEIEKILGIPRVFDGNYTNKEYYDAVSNVNAALTNVGRRLENVPGVGYVVLKPDSYPDHVKGIHSRALVKIREAIHITNYSPRDLMTVEKRLLLDRMQATMTRQILNNSDEMKMLYAAKKER